jgi:transcriptional regulator with XRE-family HTH domain
MEKPGLSKIVGENVAKQRRKMGLTQERLSEITNIAQGAISRIENGSVVPKFERLELIADALQCPVADFFRRPEDDGRKSSKTPDTDYSEIIANIIRPLSPKEQKRIVDIVAKVVGLIK